jgi:hypothetical protein
MFFCIYNYICLECVRRTVCRYSTLIRKSWKNDFGFTSFRDCYHSFIWRIDHSFLRDGNIAHNQANTLASLGAVYAWHKIQYIHRTFTCYGAIWSSLLVRIEVHQFVSFPLSLPTNYKGLRNYLCFNDWLCLPLSSRAQLFFYHPSQSLSPSPSSYRFPMDPVVSENSEHRIPHSRSSNSISMATFKIQLK